MKFIETVWGNIVNFYLVERIYFETEYLNNKRPTYTSYLQISGQEKIQFFDTCDTFSIKDADNVKMDEYLMNEILQLATEYIVNSEDKFIRHIELDNKVFNALIENISTRLRKPIAHMKNGKMHDGCPTNPS